MRDVPRLTNIHCKSVEVANPGDFVNIKLEDPPALTVHAALLLSAVLIRKAHESALRYGEGLDGPYLAKCFRGAGFEAHEDTTLGDLIKQLDEREEEEG